MRYEDVSSPIPGSAGARQRIWASLREPLEHGVLRQTRERVWDKVWWRVREPVRRCCPGLLPERVAEQLLKESA